MNFVKNSIALAMSSLLAIPAFAADKAEENIDFYGKLNISLQATEEGGVHFNELKSNASRVGVKGEYALDHGLTAIYKLEWQVNVDDDSKDSLTARNQYVGFKGGFGEATVGRADTTLKVSQGKFDLFNDYEGDLKHLFIGENRVTDSLTYKSPKFYDFQVLASYIINEDKGDEDLDNPYSVGLGFGDSSLKKTDYFLSIAHDENMPAKRLISLDNNQLSNTRITGMYKLGDFRIGGMYVDSELSTGGASESGLAGNIAYKLGSALLKVQYQEFGGADALSAGVDYKLGKSTKAFAWWTDREELITNAGDKIASEGTYFAIGMEQKF